MAPLSGKKPEAADDGVVASVINPAGGERVSCSPILMTRNWQLSLCCQPSDRSPPTWGQSHHSEGDLVLQFHLGEAGSAHGEPSTAKVLALQKSHYGFRGNQKSPLKGSSEHQGVPPRTTGQLSLVHLSSLSLSILSSTGWQIQEPLEPDPVGLL